MMLLQSWANRSECYKSALVRTLTVGSRIAIVELLKEVVDDALDQLRPYDGGVYNSRCKGFLLGLRELTGNLAEVQSAVNSASSGDTVTIPPARSHGIAT